jgi:predicted dehydrogenase
MYSDQYELWARKDIDALLIATGDRWHTLLSVLSARAGKDVYCEKPCSMTIAESRALADTYMGLGRIYQAGTQRRDGPNFIKAFDLTRAGKLGKLKAVHAEVGPGNRWPPATIHDWLPGEPEPPKQVTDWDRWLGPAPWRPYNPQYVQGKWRGYFDFHGGGILEWGAHTVDLCQWVADVDGTTPVEFEPEGMGRDTPYAVHCRYANGVQLEMRDSGFTAGTPSPRRPRYRESSRAGSAEAEFRPLRKALQFWAAAAVRRACQLLETGGSAHSRWRQRRCRG